MTRYIFKPDIDELIIDAENPRALVRELKDGPWLGHQSDEEYIKGFSSRVKKFCNIDIRYDTIDNFVQDLLSFGILEIIDDE